MKFQNSNSTNTLIHYLGCFNTNYITFRSIESFEYYFFEIKNICDVSYWFFKNNVFIELKSSKLINYSTSICQSSQGPTVTMKQKSDIKWVEKCIKDWYSFALQKPSFENAMFERMYIPTMKLRIFSFFFDSKPIFEIALLKVPFNSQGWISVKHIHRS